VPALVTLTGSAACLVGTTRQPGNEGLTRARGDSRCSSRVSGLARSRAWPPRGVADLLLLEHGHADAPTPSV